MKFFALNFACFESLDFNFFFWIYIDPIFNTLCAKKKFQSIVYDHFVMWPVTVNERLIIIIKIQNKILACLLTISIQ